MIEAHTIDGFYEHVPAFTAFERRNGILGPRELDIDVQALLNVLHIAKYIVRFRVKVGVY